jgi:hypothetical protein
MTATETTATIVGVPPSVARIGRRSIAHGAAFDMTLFGPHPPCADGKQDGELEESRENACKGPIQLVWMVNKILPVAQLAEPSPSPSRQAGWGRRYGNRFRLAHHLLHHRGKLDGVAAKGTTWN